MQKQTLTQRIRNRFAPPREDALRKALAKLISEEKQKQTYETFDQNQFKEPKYDYELLNKWGIFSPALRTTHESIITEATRNGAYVKPRWMRKCPACNTEFKTEVEKCPDCETETIEPSVAQKQLLEAFIENPNADDEFPEIRASIYRYLLRLGNAYLSIQNANMGLLRPITVYVEDATKIRKANPTHPEYFCPNCTAKYPDDVLKEGQPCRRCGETETKLTAYIYKDGRVLARWAKDEMLHFKLDAHLPDGYGLSREISILNCLGTLDAMDNFNLDNYTEGKLANILVMEGMNQDEANKLAQSAKSQSGKQEYSQTQGRWIIKKLKTLILGTGGKGGVTNVPAMPDSEAMQSLEWYKSYESRVHAIYGVQDIFAGQVQEGSTGQNPRSKNDINNNSMEFYQKLFTTPFNNAFVRDVLNISDWVYLDEALEEKDEAQEQAILTAKLNNLQLAVNLGLSAELTDEGEVKISGQPETLKEKAQRSMEQMQQQAPNGANPKDSAFEGKQAFKKENVFANEKAQIKSKYIVTELKTE